MIKKMKVHIKEDKRIEEALRVQLEERDRIIGNLEVDIFTLRKYLQMKNMQNNSKVLDKIISNQRPHDDRYRLGYTQIEIGSISKIMDHKKKKKKLCIDNQKI
jgi:hypothetical protein